MSLSFLSIARRTPAALPAVAILSLSSAALAQSSPPLYGIMFRTGGQTSGLNPILYDVNPTTGAATNPRNVNVNDCVGIAIDPMTGIMYGLTDQLGRINNQSGQGGKKLIFTIDIATGAATAVGRIDPSGVFQEFEGDIAFSPVDGSFWGVTTNVNSARLFTIDKATGLATLGATLGPVIGTDLDISALTFDAQGQMYVLDTRYPNNPGPALVERVDAASGAVQQYWNTGVNLGNVAGMTFRPDGSLLIADGDTSGTNHLYRFDLTTGTMTDIGPTNAAGGTYQGLAGLVSGTCSLAFTQQPPTRLTVCPHGAIDVTVAASGTGTVGYAWQLETTPGNWIAINNGGLPYNGGTIVASGATTATLHLTLDVLPGAPAITIRAIASNSCNASGVPSSTTTLAFCPADFNCSGTLSVQDIFDFLNAWFGGNVSADFNRSGALSVQDIFDFLNAWFTGCP